MANRLEYAFKYLEGLEKELKCGDYLSGNIDISKDEAHIILNYLLDAKKYDLCTRLVNKKFKNDL